MKSRKRTRDFHGCEIIPLVFTPASHTKSDTSQRLPNRGSRLPRCASRRQPVRTHSHLHYRTHRSAKLHATGGFGRCVRRHSRMPAHLSRTCAVRAACTLSSAYSCARAACPPVPRARLSDMRARPIRSSFQAARATCVASPLSRAQVVCPSRPAFSSRKLLPLLAALLASPIFIFSLCARLSCAV